MAHPNVTDVAELCQSQQSISTLDNKEVIESKKQSTDLRKQA